jgi:cytochrome c-type biogenesis protein
MVAMVTLIANVTHGLQSWWAPGLAFAAGVVSFASPCVLPLVPGYLSFITGEQAVRTQEGWDPPVVIIANGEGEEGAVLTAADHTAPSRWSRAIPILLFILGFSIVFTVVFGFTAGAVSSWLKSPIGQRAAGAVVLVFGVFMLLYALRTKMTWLYREERPFLTRVKPGPAGALPLGMAFAVGWTPCIGPVLGGIVTLAGNQGSTLRAVLLLFSYSMGLGIPFVLIGLGIGRLTRSLRFFSRHYRWFAGVSGLVLVGIGVLLVLGMWTPLVAPLFRVINRFTPAL